jgi:hypothetical protein
MMDLSHEVAMWEQSLSTTTATILDLSSEPWFIERLCEEDIIAAIERLQAALVLKRRAKRAA